MSAIQSFEDIEAWQYAKKLTLGIYAEFKNSKDYSFRDQIQRASVSIMNNIAEGFERQSNKDFRKFLYISKGSCGEVRSMLRLAIELGYIESQRAANLIMLATRISRMLAGFIKKL